MSSVQRVLLIMMRETVTIEPYLMAYVSSTIDLLKTMTRLYGSVISITGSVSVIHEFENSLMRMTLVRSIRTTR